MNRYEQPQRQYVNYCIFTFTHNLHTLKKLNQKDILYSFHYWKGGGGKLYTSTSITSIIHYNVLCNSVSSLFTQPMHN